MGYSGRGEREGEREREVITAQLEAACGTSSRYLNGSSVVSDGSSVTTLFEVSVASLLDR